MVTADGSGNQISQYTYDVYGKTTSAKGDSASHDVSPFAYAGEYLDKSMGLYYLRARWYDPNSGSFLSLDPMVNTTGDAYVYAAGNPLSLTDPLGLDALDEAGNFVAGFGDDATAVFGIPEWFASGGAARGEDLTHYSITYHWREATGTNYTVNPCSGWYIGGQVTSIAATLPFLAKDAIGFATKLPEIVSRFKQGVSGFKELILGVSWGDEAGSLDVQAVVAGLLGGGRSKEAATCCSGGAD